MKYGYKELKGICKNCLGCNKLEDSTFNGVDKCEYATTEQIAFKQMMIGGINSGNK